MAVRAQDSKVVQEYREGEDEVRGAASQTPEAQQQQEQELPSGGALYADENPPVRFPATADCLEGNGVGRMYCAGILARQSLSRDFCGPFMIRMLTRGWGALTAVLLARCSPAATP